ncbi:aminodeoxychorismate/anthranilate synthase component II [Rufibacter glacialis]|uniref:Aminodeoxychorismate/anthranilate synthase component II n=1 Tax=Rufibacter glacialis TaxID=1259555 RepID=A0A5M8QEM5_9BACT|nr:aminodeoxychorismate/anthranilate synthase component II [Rufibacter glacialis]KAA6434459.1 aminodeoxychorismate/anthranilate synthase component II [Rufibacter glacialis]GGK69815.1 aminodeoxychorismate/anthranilate synthase component II [Rufibacter glacialis]
MKILVLDNYDSFTYNLVQLLRELGYGEQLEVHRNDQISLEEVERFEIILLSPGPGVPSEAGIMPALLQRYAPTKRIMGVCLGHQAIGEAFGAQLANLQEVFHGVSATMRVVNSKEPMFHQLPPTFKVARYHSWTVVPESVPSALSITAVDETGEVMALRHSQYDVCGVQFHPESILTDYGKEMMQNWLQNPTKRKKQWTTFAASLTL